MAILAYPRAERHRASDELGATLMDLANEKGRPSSRQALSLVLDGLQARVGLDAPAAVVIIKAAASLLLLAALAPGSWWMHRTAGVWQVPVIDAPERWHRLALLAIASAIVCMPVGRRGPWAGRKAHASVCGVLVLFVAAATTTGMWWHNAGPLDASQVAGLAIQVCALILGGVAAGLAGAAFEHRLRLGLAIQACALLAAGCGVVLVSLTPSPRWPCCEPASGPPLALYDPRPGPAVVLAMLAACASLLTLGTIARAGNHRRLGPGAGFRISG